jgi:hypothetical protein
MFELQYLLIFYSIDFKLFLFFCHKTYNPHIICHTSTFLAQKMTSTADAELMAWPG